MRTSALYDAKTLDFLKFMVCPHGHEERRGQFFAILCGRPLYTALNVNVSHRRFWSRLQLCARKDTQTTSIRVSWAWGL